MAELAGKSCTIKVAGTATAFVGEATTMGGTNTTYQITDASKRVLDRDETIHVLVKGSNGTAEDGTTTTNIEITGHGLATGDVIINTSRSNAKREVTYVNANNVTVTAVTDQAQGDTIERYVQATDEYTVNRTNGMATFVNATPRTVLISGKYLPMSAAAYANSMSRNKSCDLLDATAFGATHKKRVPGLLHASGTLNQLDLTDTTYRDALVAGVPIVIEDRDTSTSEPNRFWALLDQDELTAAIDGLQSEAVSWVSLDEWLTLGV